MRVAYDGYDRKTGLDYAVHAQLNNHTNTERFPPKISLISPWEDQYEWHGMARMAGLYYAVMCTSRNTHTCTHTHTHLSPLSCLIITRGFLNNKYH